MPTLRRLTVLLFLITLLTPWVASAASPRAERHSRSAKTAPVSTILGRAWTFLVGAWTKEGCGIDPDGQCSPAPVNRADIGCGLDPNGHCGS